MKRLTLFTLLFAFLTLMCTSTPTPVYGDNVLRQVTVYKGNTDDAMVAIGIPWDPREDVENIGVPWFPEDSQVKGTPWFPSQADAVPSEVEGKPEAGSPANDGGKDTANLPCQVSAGFQSAAPRVFRWCGIITHYAEKHGLPANFVAAVMLQESGGNPNASSYCDATGLMQIMPRDITKKTIACGAMKCGPGKNQHCFALRPGKEELRDPEFNIAYGTKMLAGLTERLGYRGALNVYFGSSRPVVDGKSYADIVLGHWERYGEGE